MGEKEQSVIILQPEQILDRARREGEIIGTPRLTEEGISFSGGDGIILPENPLPALPELFIELDFLPASGGDEEQRFLHFGHIDGPRFLFETRSLDGRWCLDTFYNNGAEGLVLLDREKLHPEDRWYTIRAELYRDRVRSFIDGRLDGEGELDRRPFQGGRASLGVRQNLISHFSGIIGEIRIGDAQEF